MTNLLELTDRGLYCPAGDFFIDPWRPVQRAIVTHAHSDHARWGSASYLTAAAGLEVLRTRLGEAAPIETMPFGQTITHRGVRVSLHPAGHVLGAAQVRVEHEGDVWVVSGDYKLQADPTCHAFEPLRCRVFITESTFGLPVYRWRPPAELFGEINAWWRQNQAARRTSVIYAYALGKAQRILAQLDPAIGPILVHGVVERFIHAYRASGIALADAPRATAENAQATRGQALVIAPPSAAGTRWLNKFGAISTAIASGWMQFRGIRRRRGVNRGFALSDHADWDGLLWAIDQTGAEEVWVTHGYTATLTRWLAERGLKARTLLTQFEGETAEMRDDVEAPAEAEGSKSV